MGKSAGFTLVELMVVIAILGIMAATALPVYHTYQQRAYGSKALLVAKQIVDAEIMYYLDHSKFFPEDPTKPIDIPALNPPSPEVSQQINDILNALNISISVGDHLTYQIYTGNAEAEDWCQVTVRATFPLFKTGRYDIILHVNKDGSVDPI